MEYKYDRKRETYHKNPYNIIPVLNYSNIMDNVLHITLKIHQRYRTWSDPLLDIICKYWIHYTVISTLLLFDLVLLSLFDLSMFFFCPWSLKNLFSSIIETRLCSWFWGVLISNLTPISVVHQSWISSAWW